MSTSSDRHPQPAIVLVDDVPIISGTTMKVVELVMSQAAHGWSPEELHNQYPHLTPAQISAALEYHRDHQAALDADIQRRSLFVDRARQQAGLSPLARRLRRQ